MTNPLQLQDLVGEPLYQEVFIFCTNFWGIGLNCAYGSGGSVMIHKMCKTGLFATVELHIQVVFSSNMMSLENLLGSIL